MPATVMPSLTMSGTSGRWENVRCTARSTLINTRSNPSNGRSDEAGVVDSRARSSRRTLPSQRKTQVRPTVPMTRKGKRQVSSKPALPMKVIVWRTISGVSTAPTAAPLWRMLLPIVRWAGCRMCWVVRRAHGQLPASAMPRRKRQTSRAAKVWTRPVAKPASDQPRTAAAYIQRTFQRSASQPATTAPSAKALPKADSSWP